MYYIVYILIIHYSINKDITKFLVKEFGKWIFFMGIHSKKLEKAVSLILPIQRVYQDIGKYLKRYIYNSFVNSKLK